MKKQILALTIAALTVIPSLSFATEGEVEAAITPATMTRDAQLEVERVNGKVQLEVYLKNVDNVDHITVERSGNSIDGYRQVKYISSEQLDEIDGFKVVDLDKYPLPSNKSCFYRVKIVDKDGITRYYNGVRLEKA